MQRGSAEIFLGLGLIVAGVLALKLTDMNFGWLFVAFGAGLGTKGGISIAERARV